MEVLKVVKRRPIVLPLAFIAAAGMVSISESSYWQSVDTLDDLGSIGAARTTIQGVQQSMLDAETAQRGYLLTGRREHLQPYERARRDIAESLAFLDRYYEGEPRPRQVLASLRQVAAAMLSELEATIGRRDEGTGDAGKTFVLGDIGREQMDSVRALSAELLDHEARKVEASRGDLYRTLLLGRIGVAVLSAISLLALFMVLRQTFALERQQQEQQRLVQAERDRLEIEVAQRTAQLTELTHHLQTAREDERNRLARDLHDELGALLTSAKLDAARIKSRLAGTAPEAMERLTHLVATLDSVIALKRRITEDLRPSALSHLGLIATLEILTREFAERSGVAVQCALEPVELEAAAELVVYRLVQEAITNISKYAKATHVWVSMAARDGRVQVSVRDDGVGFDPAALPRSAHGLVGMRFRVEAEGGTLRLLSAPRQGTLIQVTLPESAPGKA